MHKTGFFLIGILSGFLWGLNDVITNLISNHLVILTLQASVVFAASTAFLQDSFSSISIIVYYLARRQWRQQLGKLSQIKYLMLLSGFCAGPMGLACSILAIHYAGAVYAGAITAAYPIVSLIGSTVFLKEPLPGIKKIGVLISIIAIILISIQGEHSHAPHMLLGLIFAFISIFGWGTESVLFSAAYNKTLLNSSTLLAFRQVSSSVLYLVVILIALLWYQPSFSTIKALFNFPLLLLACIISAALSYLTYYYTIKQLKASIGTLFNATFIFWSAIISTLIGIASTSPLFWLWAALLLMGIGLAYHDKTIKLPKKPTLKN